MFKMEKSISRNFFQRICLKCDLRRNCDIQVFHDMQFLLVKRSSLSISRWSVIDAGKMSEELT